MEKISVQDIQIIKTIGYGSFSDIHEVLFNNKKYAFKQFKDDRTYAKGLIPKYEELNNLGLTNSIIPNIYVEDGELNGFLMKFCNHRCFSYLYSCPIDFQIRTLKDAKKALLEVHSRNIIHGDIHVSNFLFRECLLTDFDNSEFKNFKLNPEFCSPEALNFLKTYKLSKDLDIYLFNFMTFSILNEVTYDTVESDIYEQKYGVFKTKEAKKICNSLLLEDRNFNTNFLIDSISTDATAKRKKKIGRD